MLGVNAKIVLVAGFAALLVMSPGVQSASAGSISIDRWDSSSEARGYIRHRYDTGSWPTTFRFDSDSQNGNSISVMSDHNHSASADVGYPSSWWGDPLANSNASASASWIISPHGHSFDLGVASEARLASGRTNSSWSYGRAYQWLEFTVDGSYEMDFDWSAMYSRSNANVSGSYAAHVYDLTDSTYVLNITTTTGAASGLDAGLTLKDGHSYRVYTDASSRAYFSSSNTRTDLNAEITLREVPMEVVPNPPAAGASLALILGLAARRRRAL